MTNAEHEATPLIGMRVIARSVPGRVARISGDNLIVLDDGGTEWTVRPSTWRQWLANMRVAKVALPKDGA